MLLKVITYILGAAAIGLIVLGLSWPALFPPSAYWTPAQALEYQDAFRAAHDAADHHDRPGNPNELQVTRERYERLQRELGNAQKAHGRAGHSLVVLGLVLSLASILAHRFLPKSADDRDA